MTFALSVAGAILLLGFALWWLNWCDEHGDEE